MNPPSRQHAGGRPTADRSRTTGDEPEIARFVWARAVGLAGPQGHEDLFRLSLDLLRTARHDPATLVDASDLGREWVRAHPDDSAGGLGAGLLERVISFLGLATRSAAVAR